MGYIKIRRVKILSEVGFFLEYFFYSSNVKGAFLTETLYKRNSKSKK